MNARMLGLYLCFFVVLIGCGLANSDFFYKNYEIGKVMEANVGSEMVVKESGRKNDVYNTFLSGMRMELIYGGVANDVVKVVYREYTLGEGGGAYARPAFSQELQYDLKQSMTITFRNTKIEVLSAANDKIVFKVLESPDRPSGSSALTDSKNPCLDSTYVALKKKQWVYLTQAEKEYFQKKDGECDEYKSNRNNR